MLLEPGQDKRDAELILCRLLRFLLGVVIAGMWPGMAYYLTLFYPPSRTGKRIGYYFTASQVSASVVGLASAGFQKMDGLGGLVGFQWMFLLWGLCAIILGVVLLWWLPDRPLPPGEQKKRTGLMKWLPATPPVLIGGDAEIHYRDLTRVYHSRPWNFKDLVYVLIDWRLWPLTLMYFGVVGVGIGTQLYATVIISGINSSFSGVTLSLLVAPIWMVSEVFYRSRVLTDAHRWTSSLSLSSPQSRIVSITTALSSSRSPSLSKLPDF